MFLAFALTLGLSVAEAACPASADAVREGADGAYAAYLDFEVADFSARAQVLRGDVACLTEVVDPATATRIHLVEALAAWLQKDQKHVMASFRGVLAANPGFTLSADVAPTGSQVRSFFDAARAVGGGGWTPVVNAGVSYTVDGRPSAAGIPSERAALVQVRSSTGVRTWYLNGDGLPADLRVAITSDSTAKAPLPAVSQPAVTEEEPKTGRRRHPSRTLMIEGGVASTASVLLLTTAAVMKSSFSYSDRPRDAYIANHTVGNTGYALGVVGIGLGITGIAIGKW